MGWSQVVPSQDLENGAGPYLWGLQGASNAPIDPPRAGQSWGNGLLQAFNAAIWGAGILFLTPLGVLEWLMR